MYQDWMERVPVIGDIKPNNDCDDNALKQQIKDLVHEYSTPTENGRRFIDNDNLQLFFKKLLVLIGW